jgi:hypothetical protein
MFAAEHSTILVELDSARRHFLKSAQDVAELRRDAR